jgi:hypothetical protein
MLALHVTSKPANVIVNLDHVVSIEYDPNSAELSFIVGTYARNFRLDSGTPEGKVFDALKKALNPIYEPRSLQTHGVYLALDLLQFQKEEVPF